MGGYKLLKYPIRLKSWGHWAIPEGMCEAFRITQEEALGMKDNIKHCRCVLLQPCIKKIFFSIKIDKSGRKYIKMSTATDGT